MKKYFINLFLIQYWDAHFTTNYKVALLPKLQRRKEDDKMQAYKNLKRPATDAPKVGHYGLLPSEKM